MNTQDWWIEGNAAADMTNDAMNNLRAMSAKVHNCIEQIEKAVEEARQADYHKATKNWNVQLAKMTELAAAIDKFL